MAIELFKPFIMKRLVETGVVSNVKTARKWLIVQALEVWTRLK